MAGKGKTIKVCLTNRGGDSETPWAEDLGPAKGAKGARRVRLVNVPFMHAKPTWGDVIVVVPEPASDGMPTWDRQGVAWEDIATRIEEDGGRWAMIVDYKPRDVSASDAFRALVEGCHHLDVVCEGAWGPSDGRAGRVYLAAPHGRAAREVMKSLADEKLPCVLTQIHPPPATAKAKPATKAVAAAKAKPAARAKPAAKAVAVAKAVPAAKSKPAAKPAKSKRDLQPARRT